MSQKLQLSITPEIPISLPSHEQTKLLRMKYINCCCSKRKNSTGNFGTLTKTRHSFLNERSRLVMSKPQSIIRNRVCKQSIVDLENIYTRKPLIEKVILPNREMTVDCDSDINDPDEPYDDLPVSSSVDDKITNAFGTNAQNN